MSTAQEIEKSQGSREVIRLKVEGAGTVVNTLRDQQTARGLSLVCPFPALEVDIPVILGSGEDQQRGSIHRIGVEDDPRSGLPRLRLSVRAFPRTSETRATVVSPPEASLLGEASRATRLPTGADKAETDLDVLAEPADTADLLDELLGGKRDRAAAADSYGGLDPNAGRRDPEWAALCEIPLPETLSPRSVTRRRKRLASAAAWTMVAGLVAGGVFVLDRAGLIDVDETRRAVMDSFGRSRGDSEAIPVAAVAVGPAEVLRAFEETAPAPAPAPTEVPAADGGDADATGLWEGSPGFSPVAEPVPAVEPPPAVEVAVEGAGAAAIADAEAGDGVATEGADDVTLVLPTRWPAEYSTAYRLRDPNGVVVDIPGALVRKEGWLDLADGHPMIRSVKAMQRESGARFVIYVNGELPRFVTAPKTGGIAVRLFREGAEEPTPTEQVALLD